MKTQFGSFYDILQSRCISYDIRSQNDWRRILCEESCASATETDDKIRRYWLLGQDSEDEWQATLQKITSSSVLARDDPDACAEEIQVYGRAVQVPWSKNGVAMFTFDELCNSPLAGADYISIASRYHTIVLDDVPALKLTQKNQARRMITLLDALYESRVRLVIRAEKDIDELFFAEMKRDDGRPVAEVKVTESRGHSKAEEDDSLELEMYSELDLDLSSPYRPNVSAYDETEKEATFAKAAAPATTKKASDYTSTTAFTGEDERFAFKRAISRLKEMTGSDMWWEQGRWLPVEAAARMWEANNASAQTRVVHDEGPERALAHDQRNAYQRGEDAPPRFSVAHFWSMISWGEGKRRDAATRRWMRGADVYREEKRD